MVNSPQLYCSELCERRVNDGWPAKPRRKVKNTPEAVMVSVSVLPAVTRADRAEYIALSQARKKPRGNPKWGKRGIDETETWNTAGSGQQDDILQLPVSPMQMGNALGSTETD